MYNALIHVYNALIHVYNALIHVYNSLIHVYNALIHVYNALIHGYNALIHVYNALIHVYNALIHVYNALIHVYNSLIHVYNALIHVYMCVLSSMRILNTYTAHVFIFIYFVSTCLFIPAFIHAFLPVYVCVSCYLVRLLITIYQVSCYLLLYYLLIKPLLVNHSYRSLIIHRDCVLILVLVCDIANECVLLGIHNDNVCYASMVMTFYYIYI